MNFGEPVGNSTGSVRVFCYQIAFVYGATKLTIVLTRIEGQFYRIGLCGHLVRLGLVRLLHALAGGATEIPNELVFVVQALDAIADCNLVRLVVFAFHQIALFIQMAKKRSLFCRGQGVYIQLDLRTLVIWR